MKTDAPNTAWVPKVEKDDGPMYLTIASAIANDIRAGILKPGQRLPPQRALAEALGIDFTTVSRAYAAAGKDGMVEGRVGQGTYVMDAVSASPKGSPPAKDQAVDLAMNIPPRPGDSDLISLMWRGFEAVRSEQGSDFLMRYQFPGGSPADRAVAQEWLKNHIHLPGLDDVIICNGVQGATLSILSLVVKPGDTVCCEELTYPGFLAIARQLNLDVITVPMDGEGIEPSALADACRKNKPKYLYTTPTLHNPTTITMSRERREEIARTARECDLQIIEDDAYGILASASIEPIAYFAPERTWYVSSLSKCLAPSLRVCFVVPPSDVSGDGVRRAIRANGSVVSPLSAGLATEWITSGLAEKVTASIRAETKKRQEALLSWLPEIEIKQDAFHVWLELPADHAATELVLNLRGSRLGLVPGSAFTTETPPNAVRIALGSADSMGDLQSSLRRLADALKHPRESNWMVV